MNDLKIRQTNLQNGAVETGKYYPKIDCFYGIRAYTNEDRESRKQHLQNGDKKFTVSWGIEAGSKILYEVIE